MGFSASFVSLEISCTQFFYTCIRLHTYIFSTFPQGLAVFIWSVFGSRKCVRVYYRFFNDMFTRLFSLFFCGLILVSKRLPNSKGSRELVRPHALLSEHPLPLQEEKLHCQLWLVVRTYIIAQSDQGHSSVNKFFFHACFCSRGPRWN